MPEGPVPDMVPTVINGRWTLQLPPHRAAFPEWSTWEAPRLAAMHDVIVAMRDSRNLPVTWPTSYPVIYDIGSEEGDLPALWASWGAGVVMVEPDCAVWPNIKAIWDANELPAPLGCFAGFAGARPHTPTAGDVDRRLSFGATGTVWPECVNGPVIDDHGFCTLWERPDIPCTTIDDAPGIPTVITIDVEGAELEVLKGADMTLAEYRPVVFVSIHPEFMNDAYDTSPQLLLDLMAGHGYQHHLLGIDHEVHVQFTHPANRWATPRAVAA